MCYWSSLENTLASSWRWVEQSWSPCTSPDKVCRHSVRRVGLNGFSAPTCFVTLAEQAEILGTWLLYSHPRNYLRTKGIFFCDGFNRPSYLNEWTWMKELVLLKLRKWFLVRQTWIPDCASAQASDYNRIIPFLTLHATLSRRGASWNGPVG